MDAERNPERGLTRRLGLLPATLAGIGIILGAGIYVLVGVAAGRAGNAVWLSFLIAAAAAGLTGLSYARLGRLRPKDAPEFQYLGLAFGRAPAFLAAWLVLWAAVISSAAVALGFAGYLEHLTGAPPIASALGLVLVSCLIVFWGVGESAITAGVLTIVEVSGLVFIIAVGLPHLGQVGLLEMPTGIAGVVGAASLVFFAYLGFESMANFSEEMRNPERDLPRAILLALAVSSVFYVLVAVSTVSVLGWRDLSQSSAPLAAVAARVLGDKAELLLSLIAQASTANTVLLLLFAASRAMWAMSCAGALPTGLCVIGERRRTPWPAIIIVGAIAGLFVLVGEIEDVAEFTNFATLLAFAGVNASTIKVFAANKGGGRLRHLLVDLALPALGIVVSLFLAASAGWRAALLGGGLLASGSLVYLVMARLSRKGKE